MIKTGKKCICKSCDKCNFYEDWILTDEKGNETVAKRCSFGVLFAEIAKIRGSIDGLQGGVNEARNRAMETAEIGRAVGEQIVQFAHASHKALERVSHKLIELRGD